MTIRLLALDIETGPAQVWTFGLFKPYLSDKHVITSSRMICFTAQWVEEGVEHPVLFFSEHSHGRKQMLDAIWELLNECDAVITYNGKTFDIPWITGELSLDGYTPPKPYHHIDLFQVIKSSTYLLTKKLDYVAHRYLDDSKVTHEGIQLWIGCMNGDAESWQRMEEYARKDTALLGPLYFKLRPWIRVHPNVNLYTDKPEALACDRCTSTNLKKNGFRLTATKRFQVYACKDCGRQLSSRRGSVLAATGPAL